MTEPQTASLPPQAGTNLKYDTALRIAKNIAAANGKPDVDAMTESALYRYLRETWGFRWSREREKWEQQ